MRRAFPARGGGSAARRAARSPLIGWFGRAGFLAQGVCFLLIGVLAIALATGAGGEATDPEGALVALARGGWTRIVLVVLAIGFCCYAVWRLAQALLDRGGMGSEAGGLARRAIQLVQGLTYVALAVSSVRLLVHGSDHRSGSAKRATAGMLGWPAGRELVAALGLVFGAVAVGNVYWALTRRFKESISTNDLGEAEERMVTAVGSAGFLALAAVFGIISWFLLKAAVQFDPHDAVSIGGALARLSRVAYGEALLAVVATGLCLFGVFGLVQARLHRV
jgi:hypothetical protein